MKILFIDADGTLLHHEGFIPKSALRACQKAQKNGHKICLCTGRQRIEVYGDMLKLDYDGLITGSGASVEVRGNILEEKNFSIDQIRFLIDYLNRHQINALYEMNDGLAGTKNTQEAIQKLVQKYCGHLSGQDYEKHGLVQVLHNLKIYENIEQLPVNKISFLESGRSYQQVEEDLQDYFDCVPSTFEPFGNQSGEISEKNITKAHGMDTLLAYYNATPEDAIAIGDGFNDLCMFEKAKISVAMGNADPKVKEKADMVTDDLLHDGVFNAFKELHLI